MEDGIDKISRDLWMKPSDNEPQGAAYLVRELEKAVKRYKAAKYAESIGQDVVTLTHGETIDDMLDKITILVAKAKVAGVTDMVIGRIYIDAEASMLPTPDAKP